MFCLANTPCSAGKHLFRFCDVYFLKKDVPLKKMVMQKGETCAAKWVSRAEFERMIAQKQIAQPDVKRYYELGEKLADLLR